MAQDYNPISGFTNAKSLMEEAQMVQTLGDGATSGASTSTGGSGIKGAKGAAIAGQVAGVASGLIDTEDALSKNSVGKAAAAKGLEYAAMGSALGPWGAVAGLAVGGVVGAVEGSKAKEEALKQVEINKGITASAEVDKNKYEMEQYDYSKINPDGTMATKYGVVKKLGAITGTVANNMSVAQYNSAIKMSGIAKNMDEPIKKIDPMYNNKPGVQQDDFEQYK